LHYVVPEGLDSLSESKRADCKMTTICFHVSCNCPVGVPALEFDGFHKELVKKRTATVTSFFQFNRHLSVVPYTLSIQDNLTISILLIFHWEIP
jgi:hypothetical protein